MKKTISLLILAYFRFFAKVQLKKFAPDIIGITGSLGKTTTRNAVAAILSEKYKLKVTKKANSESGIPLDILGLHVGDYSVTDWLRLLIQTPFQLLFNWQPYEKYIVEMGIDSPYPPKNMSYLLTIVQPRTAIFLNAAAVHIQFFKSIAAIADEKGKLIQSLPENGLAVLNCDDENVMAFSKQTKAQVMTFGKNTHADVVIKSLSRNSNSTLFVFLLRGESLTLKFDFLLPDHFGYLLAPALCIGLDEGMTLTEMKQLLENHFRVEPGRMSIFDGVNNSRIIDSSYNASPESMIEMLKLLKDIPGKKKIALLGDMRELGNETQPAHERVMDNAQQIVDEIVLVGPLMHKYALPYMSDRQVTWFDSAVKAAQYLKGVLQNDDVLLVKGSQNTIFLESAVEELLKNKHDSSRLCRRGEYWNSVRRKYI